MRATIGRTIGIGTLSILIGLMPISVVPSVEVDVCDIVSSDFSTAAVQPCPTRPPEQTIPGMICDAAYMASCRNVPCRCATYAVCFGPICAVVTICEEFISTGVQFPRCRPRPNAECKTTSAVCGKYFKYLGRCGGLRIHSFDGYIATCER